MRFVCWFRDVRPHAYARLQAIGPLSAIIVRLGNCPGGFPDSWAGRRSRFSGKPAGSITASLWSARAGLLAGSGLAIIVGAFVTWLAVWYDGRSLAFVGISILCGGLAGGWLYRWRPRLAQQPLTGFCLTFTVALLGEGLTLLCVPDARVDLQTFGQTGIASVLQASGTALILALVLQAREHDEQARAASVAEVSALQARMNPHFLFNALNTLAALANVAPREIPRAVGRLRLFLRASFDQHDRALIPLELALTRAYLNIESLRLGSRLKVEEAIDSGLAEVLAPPFSLQPLVENAVQHGLQSSPKAGRLRIAARRAGTWLEMTVSDDGQGVPSAEVEHVFFRARPEVHALALLHRRLQALFGHSFRLEARSDVEQGSTVTIRIPLRTAIDVAERADAEWVNVFPDQNFCEAEFHTGLPQK